MNGLASITPDQTHALVVGIESYAGGPYLNLDGPANDAYQFVRWLQGHGVPDENIILLVSPLEKNLGQFRDLGGIDCSLKPVTQEVVEQALKKLRQKRGLLILFWSGHGIMTTDDETRRPLLANYSEDDKHNLNLNSLRVHLRASEFGYPENQFILVDTCAVEFDERSNREKLHDTEFGRKGKSGDCNQFIIFSTENRNAAENLTSERIGLFFKELMEVLRPEAHWPPDMAATFAKLKERFDKRSQTSQQPVYCEYADSKGTKSYIFEGVGDVPGYLAALEKELSRTPSWLRPRPGVEFFQDLHIQVRVSSERREPAQDRERERRRRAGGLIVEDEEWRRSAYRHPADEAQFAEKKLAQPPLPWWDPTAPDRSARRRYRWAVLLGDPGIGKTTLLHYEGWLTAREQAERLRNGTIEIKDAVLPLYVKLADLAKDVTQNRDMVETLADLVTDPRRGGLIVSPPWDSSSAESCGTGRWCCCWMPSMSCPTNYMTR